MPFNFISQADDVRALTAEANRLLSGSDIDSVFGQPVNKNIIVHKK